MQFWLKKLLRREAQPEEIESEPELPVGQRYPLLAQLMQSRQMLEATNVFSPQLFQTFIVNLDERHGVVQLDELFPFPRGTQMQPGDKLTLKHHADNRVLECQGTVIGVSRGPDHPSLFMQLPPPEQLFYVPRRSQSRLTIADDCPLAARAWSDGVTPWFANICNISHEGMLLNVKGNICRHLVRGGRLRDITLELHDQRLKLNLVLKQFRYLQAPKRVTQLHVCFAEIDDATEQSIDDFISLVSDTQDRLNDKATQSKWMDMLGERKVIHH